MQDISSSFEDSNRIRKRGRSYERDIDREYLAQLNFGYKNGPEKSRKVGMCWLSIRITIDHDVDWDGRNFGRDWKPG